MFFSSFLLFFFSNLLCSLNCLSVFDHFVGLGLKEIISNYAIHLWLCFSIWSKSIPLTRSLLFLAELSVFSTKTFKKLKIFSLTWDTEQILALCTYDIIREGDHIHIATQNAILTGFFLKTTTNLRKLQNLNTENLSKIQTLRWSGIN